MEIKRQYQSDDIKIQAICTDYWAVNDKQEFIYTVTALRQKYELKQNELLNIAKNHSSVIFQAMCFECGAEYIERQIYQRKDYDDILQLLMLDKTAFICPICQVEAERIAQEQQQFLDQQRYEYLEKILINSLNNFPNEAFTLKQKISLLAAMRFAINEDFSCIQAITHILAGKLTPSTDLDRQIIEGLYRVGLLAISPNSDKTAFTWQENSEFHFNPLGVDWIVVTPPDCTLSQFIPN
ncbi:hypothetical protein EGK75_06115 [Neisseria weixii]|uniref:Uncharacterized protein n=1 Tax=Neisseria weixii TaxID=1853276 RepID=A0A3N4N7J2_9NEIS|nr:hypothetical protein [Neisseria weixii]RPD87279.1 hypothetical protein EGK74_06175 [Neisseria weixii]RPD88937.1 hypothetical protein EGK75_06115 [Neisseria weixii]